MTSVWVATVPRQPSVPLDQVHVMLYSYFPGVTRGDARPYVWRLLSAEQIGIVSAIRPTANNARQVAIPVGATLDFRLTYKRVRNVGGSYTRPDGTRRPRAKQAVTITSMPELRERMIAFAAGRGGAIGYVRLDNMRDVGLPDGIRLPIVDAVGRVLVTDPERFASLLTGGGPGTGKVYGLGAWWLPELMDHVQRVAA